MNKTFKDLLIIPISTLLLTLLIWLPHLLQLHSFLNLDFSAGFNTIYRNYDGLEYVVIAKSFYDPSLIKPLSPIISPNYYASHFPGYSILILLFAPLFGFLKSMLFVSLASTIASACAFYLFISKLKLTNHPLLLSLIFLILPARWLIVHSVGSSEPTFIFFVITCLYFFIRFEQTGNFADVVLSALAALAAQLIRPPGILLFIALGGYVLWKYFLLSFRANRSISRFFSLQISQFVRNDKEVYDRTKNSFILMLNYFPFLMVPLGLLGIFYWYSLTYHDFFAYFHSGDNIHLTFPPFQIFNKTQYWVGDIWLEDIIYIFIIGFYGGILLLKQKLYPLAFFVLAFLTASIFVAHRDISRYTLPILPFVLIAYEKVLTSKEFRIVLIILALGIFLYTQNFIINNTAPIPNLEIFN
jgi:hypothetical protein